MAAITTAAPGPWSTPGTWTGGVIPGNGDTVTINHAVTVSDNRIVGHSPAAGDGTKALHLNSASLTINAGVILTVRGDILVETTDLILTDTATLEFDASQAGIPSTARYTCQIGIFASDSARLVVNGTSGNRATIQSVNTNSGANGRFTNNGNDNSCLVAVDYCDFLRIGDASNNSFSGMMGGGRTFSIKHSTFTSCGAIATAYTHPEGHIILENVTTKASANTISAYLVCDTKTTGTRSIVDCDFDKPIWLYNCTGYTITGSVLRNWDLTGGPWATFSGNLIVFGAADAGDWVAAGPVTDCYVLRIGDISNPHYLTTDSNTTNITGNIFDAPDGVVTGGGDCITLSNPGSATTVTVANNIVLQTESGGSPGSLVSALGGANLTLDIDHNTYVGNLGVYIGETYAGHIGMLSSCQSNLAFSETAATAYIISADPGVVQNVVLSANVTNNGVWNPISTDGYDNDLSFSSGTPGANDVIGNPSFVDIGRNVKKFDTSLSGAGTVSNFLTEIGKRNDGSGYNASYTIAALRAYVLGGMAPTNVAFQAAHDGVNGGWIGAVTGLAPSGVHRGPLSGGLLQLNGGL